jgi:hypothetical protein
MLPAATDIHVKMLYKKMQRMSVTSLMLPSQTVILLRENETDPSLPILMQMQTGWLYVVITDILTVQMQQLNTPILCEDTGQSFCIFKADKEGMQVWTLQRERQTEYHWF